MEIVVERALKSSFFTDIALQNTTQQLCNLDDASWFASAAAGGFNSVTVDDFSVDDLLDFSDKEFKDGHHEDDDYEEEDEEEKGSLLVSSSSYQHCNNSNSSSFSETDDFGSLLASQLALPADDLENLEWLSQFVDDSQSELSLLCPAGSFKDKTVGFEVNRFEPGVEKIVSPSFPLPVPRKIRSKRERPNGRKAWSRSPSLTTTPESSSISSSSSYGSSSLSPFVWMNPFHDFELFSSVEKPPAKKQKNKPGLGDNNGSGFLQTIRRCSHCQVQKTPQWRTGPLGPKTLCNACGVRYKSGRLFPEYRPACSPTFSQEMHSNSHRKVLEMRRKNEGTGFGEEAGLTSMVQSF